jgi:hypothetical protein
MKRVTGKMALLTEISGKSATSAEIRIQSFSGTLDVIRASLPGMLDTLQRIQADKLLQHQSAVGAPGSSAKGKKSNKKTALIVRTVQDKEDAGMTKLVEHLNKV